VKLTATIVWKTIMESGVSPNDIILWNIFPFHPFNPAKGMMSNRTPRSDELSMGVLYLNELIKLLPKATLISPKGYDNVRLLILIITQNHHPLAISHHDQLKRGTN
jgi:hypothetical protein